MSETENDAKALAQQPEQSANFAELFNKTEMPQGPRPLTREEMLVLELNRARLEAAAKDVLLIDQQVKLLGQKRIEANNRLAKLQEAATMFEGALCNNLGLSTLNGWNLDFQTGKLSKNQ